MNKQTSAMDGTCLLILDRSPERAIQAKKWILDSGINIRINHCGTLYELNHHLRDHSPFLVITHSDGLPTEQATELTRLSIEHDIPVLFVADPTETDFMNAALREQAATVLPSHAHDQLPRLVNRYLHECIASRQLEDNRQRAEVQEQQFRKLFEHSGEPVAYIHEGLHLDANPAYLRCFQLDSVAQLTGVSLLDLMRGVGFDLKEALRDIDRHAAPKQPFSVEVLPPEADNFRAEISLLPVQYSGEGCMQVIIRALRPQSARPRPGTAHEIVDSVTGMLHRETFLPLLASHLAKSERGQPSGALLYLAPDGFSDYRDTLGYAGADQFLADFTCTVSACLGDSDVACRFSDHELAILLRSNDHDSLDELAESVLNTTAEHSVSVGHVTLNTRCSIGGLPLSPAIKSVDEAMQQARTAYRKASEQGHQFVRYKPKLSMIAMDAHSEAGWQERLHFALEDGNFYSIQQTITNLDNEARGLIETCSYLREEDGTVNQRQFMVAAETCQLGSEVDRAILPGIIDAIASQSGHSRNLLTISANSLLSNGFCAWLHSVVADRGVNPERLLLQVSAPSILHHGTLAAKRAEALQQFGCRLVLTDFDHEPRCLKMAGDLHVPLIKLAPNLTSELLHDEDQRDRVGSLVRTVTDAGIEVMVEGISSTSQLAALWQAGIRLVGGEFLQDSYVAAS